MLGVPPIQKPDAYIHFAPKERVELKYCVSIDTADVPSAPLKKTASRQVHEAVGMKIPVAWDATFDKLSFEFPDFFAAVQYRGTPTPYISGRTARGNLSSFYQAGGGGGPLMLREPATRMDWLELLIAPFGSNSVQFKHLRPGPDPTGNTESSWTYKGAESISGISVYHLTAQRTYFIQTGGQIISRVEYWFRIKDSSLERCEATIPKNDRGYVGCRFVVTRIR